MRWLRTRRSAVRICPGAPKKSIIYRWWAKKSPTQLPTQIALRCESKVCIVRSWRTPLRHRPPTCPRTTVALSDNLSISTSEVSVVACRKQRRLRAGSRKLNAAAKEKSGSASFTFGRPTCTADASARKKRRRSDRLPCRSTRRKGRVHYRVHPAGSPSKALDSWLLSNKRSATLVRCRNCLNSLAWGQPDWISNLSPGGYIRPSDGALPH